MIIFVYGYPNSGKTTYSNRYEQVIRLDDYNFEQKISDYILENFDLSKDICIEGDICLDRYKRKHFYDSALSSLGVPTECIFMNTDPAICEARESRGRNMKCTRPIDLADRSEGWDYITEIVNNTIIISH